MNLVTYANIHTQKQMNLVTYTEVLQQWVRLKSVKFKGTQFTADSMNTISLQLCYYDTTTSNNFRMILK